MKFSQPKRVCLNLRQKAIIFSILIFIMSVVATTCLVLGSLHTKQLLRLLEDDIASERTKCCERHTNEVNLLECSAKNVASFDQYMEIGMWLSCTNLLMTATMVYGVFTRNPPYIIPWLIMSVIFFIVCVVGLVVFFSKLMPVHGDDHRFILMTIPLVLFVIFMMFWTSINRYCRFLRTSESNTVFKSYGGYTHTIKPAVPFLAITEKPIV